MRRCWYKHQHLSRMTTQHQPFFPPCCFLTAQQESLVTYLQSLHIAIATARQCKTSGEVVLFKHIVVFQTPIAQALIHKICMFDKTSRHNCFQRGQKTLLTVQLPVIPKWSTVTPLMISYDTVIVQKSLSFIVGSMKISSIKGTGHLKLKPVHILGSPCDFWALSFHLHEDPWCATHWLTQMTEFS